jgi:nitrile hydratase
VKSGIFNMDEYRHAIERMEPRHYVAASYYERSLTSLASLLVEKGLVTRDELERRADGGFPLASPSAPGRSNLAGRERFRVGDAVVVRAEHVPGHVRMPPVYPFPDAHAHGVAADDEPTYDVRFSTAELWPNGADAAFVHVAVFQSYLQRAR